MKRVPAPTHHSDLETLRVNVHGSTENWKHLLRNGNPMIFTEEDAHLHRKEEPRYQDVQNVYIFNKNAPLGAPKSMRTPKEEISQNFNTNLSRAGTPRNPGISPNNSSLKASLFIDDNIVYKSNLKHVLDHTHDTSRAGVTKDCSQIMRKKFISAPEYQQGRTYQRQGHGVKDYNAEKASAYTYQILSPKLKKKEIHHRPEHKLEQSNRAHFPIRATKETNPKKERPLTFFSPQRHRDEVRKMIETTDRKSVSRKRILCRTNGTNYTTDSSQMKNLLTYNAPSKGILKN